MSPAVDSAFIRQMQKRMEAELAQKEQAVLAYWRGELEKTVKRRHQDLASLTNDLQKLLDRMDKRISVIRY